MAKRGLPAPALGYEAQRHVTYLPIFSAEGKLFESFFFIEGTRLFHKYRDAWPEACVMMTESGGIDKPSWQALYDRLEAKLPTPCILLLDGHGTRHSDQRRLYDGMQRGLRINLNPANSTHATQVHDVPGGPFTYFKPALRDIKDAAMHAGVQPHPENLIMWTKEAMGNITNADGTIKGVKTGFAKTRIYPFKPEAWTEKDFEAANKLGELQREARISAGLPGVADVVAKELLRPLISPKMLNERMKKFERKKAPFAFINSYEAMAERVMVEEREQADAAAAAAATAAARAAKSEAAAAAKTAKAEAKAAAAAAARAAKAEAEAAARAAKAEAKAAAAAAAAAAKQAKQAEAKRPRVEEAPAVDEASRRKRARIEDADEAQESDELERRRAMSRQRREQIRT